MKTLSIKNSWFSESDLRLDASYHLSDGPITKIILKKSPYLTTTLSEESERIFSGNIFKRTFVSNKDRGWDYLTGSDMVKSDIDSGKFISKKYTDKADNLRIHKDWILITCSGTIGNTVYTNDNFEGRIGTHDLIRVIPKENKTKKGFLYAYLSSKYGQGLLTQSSYGGVIQHIEPNHISDLPIPVFPKNKQEEIHNMIIEASKLRVEASKLLSEAIVFFDKLKIDYKYGTNTSKLISINSISSGYKRFDSAYAIVCSKVEDSLKDDNISFKTIKSQALNIFIGPRSKRNYVANGVPFLSTSAMQKANPTYTEKYLSVKNASGFIVKNGWLLTTRSGTLGDTIFALPCLDGYAVSEDAIRIVIKEKSELSTEYIYAFLKSNIGKSSLLSGSYGSVIQHLNEDYIGDIRVPVLETNNIQSIEEKIKLHLSCLNSAIINENKAIDLVEKEIESWQKS